jgi:hypothetical protein
VKLTPPCSPNLSKLSKISKSAAFPFPSDPASDKMRSIEVDMNEAGRIAELEEQVRALLAEKRGLEEKVEELTPRKIYIATTNEWFWREV